MSTAKMLPGPYEILELADGQSIELTIKSYEVGNVTIHPRYLPPGQTKTVKAMRIYLDPKEKTIGPPYWDITSQLLVTHLESVIKTAGKLPLRVRIKAFGYPPRKRFQLEVLG